MYFVIASKLLLVIKFDVFSFRAFIWQLGFNYLQVSCM